MYIFYSPHRRSIRSCVDGIFKESELGSYNLCCRKVGTQDMVQQTIYKLIGDAFGMSPNLLYTSAVGLNGAA